MKIRVYWYAGIEDEKLSLLRKNWMFDSSDFNGEVPRLGEKISLSLPIRDDARSGSSLSESSSWVFQVTDRRWEPAEKAVCLQVELNEVKRFWKLSDENKAKLAEKLEQERQIRVDRESGSDRTTKIYE